MGFVLVVVLVVAAGWLYMASRGDLDGAGRAANQGSDDHVPGNVYENPYDTNENNDRPFEPDADRDEPCDSPSDESPGDSDD